MITFDEYMGFSDSVESQEKKPGKIRQFFKKHGKKIAVGAGMLGAGILGYMIGRRGFGANNGANANNANGATNKATNTSNNIVTKVTTPAKPTTPVVTNQNATGQGTNGLSRDMMSQLNAQANARARQQVLGKANNAYINRSQKKFFTNPVAKKLKIKPLTRTVGPAWNTAKQIKANNKRFGVA